jgi:glycosyltransferase involved in cell wall biosynthesis
MQDPCDYDVLCFSHLRWDFVYQRPQHLLSRFAREHRVYFIEEPLYDAPRPRLTVMSRGDNVWVVIPRLPPGLAPAEAVEQQRRLVDELVREERIARHLQWFYTPMALAFAEHLHPLARVYDCMDELSGFAGAPPELAERERALFACADLVFTGGQSLYEAKRGQHPRVHAFPSGIDQKHFGRAREALPDPDDQAAIPRPRLGFFGVVDERMDLELLAGVAEARPDWHLVMIGPVVKIDPASLPRRPNIHWLGGRPYGELPRYLANWDAAILPFARNDATRFISPTKTPEYLAAGKPVVSTSIRDVVRPYGERGLVGIADTPETFIAAVLRELGRADPRWHADVATILATCEWDDIWARMYRQITSVIRPRASRPHAAAGPMDAAELMNAAE